MFWSEGDDPEKVTPVWTLRDEQTYTHIIYLDVPAEVLVKRCRGDTSRNRVASSVGHLKRWQGREKAELRKICYQSGILFLVIQSDSVEARDVAELLRYFREYDEFGNLLCAERKLDRIIATHGELKSMVILDGDKTMAAVDTGAMFWETVRNSRGCGGEADVDDPWQPLFGSFLGYSHLAFRQASLLFEEWADPQTFESICNEVAAQVTLYPEIVSLLKQVRAEEHAGAVVVTCGVALIWQKVLESNGFADKFKVIGNGRISNGLIVDADVKGALTTRMRHQHNLFVTALGDSVLDLPMLSKSNQAIVVVGHEQSRSKTMDTTLAEWIKDKGLRARQALLGLDATPCLDFKRLPQVQLKDPSFADVIFPHRHGTHALRFIHLTDSKATKTLMTPMRDATNSGPNLRDAHKKTGWYLATNTLVDVIGIEEHQIPHVQGNQTTGYRLAEERSTLIVALMRGGEPMAFGVNDAFRLASFLHTKQPSDITLEHLRNKSTVILVDSVVNSGKTMLDFTYHVHNLAPYVQIVMVAGVVQTQAVTKLEKLQDTIRHGKISLVALRKSDNHFIGKGSTDTGNRLFQTEQLP